ncbi:MAG: protein kinase [Myxococcales bacterium]|nr:protein kinase [Myxococcales bacterium]
MTEPRGKGNEGFSTTVEAGEGGSPPASVRSIGTIIAGKYVVERILGRGGMGIVFGARHQTLGEPVAIKFMSSEAAKDPTSAERFLREARASLRVKGEHVVRVLDVGLEEGIPYLVMEYLEGTDLATELADRGPLAIHDVALYILQACEALAEAHGHGIVHRDIKPSNLFLATRPDGSPMLKVLDFGIAKALVEVGEDTPALTDTRAVFGSPAYMSPEQIRSAKHVDARTDIWALGVVMYELLTGQHPFSGESSVAILASVSADTPKPIRSLRADIPRDFAQAVERCLEKDPNRRTASVLDLAIALEPFAPAGQVSTDRIRRLSGLSEGRVRARRALPSSGDVTKDATGAPWSTTHRPRRRRGPLLLGIFVLVAAGGASAVFLRARAVKPLAPAGPATVAVTTNPEPKSPVPNAITAQAPTATPTPEPSGGAAPVDAGAGSTRVAGKRQSATTPPPSRLTLAPSASAAAAPPPQVAAPSVPAPPVPTPPAPPPQPAAPAGIDEIEGQRR